MLTYLSIKNVVLIEALTLDFQAGFCALTGETGAGKSILLDSLGLALGARSDFGLIRKGTDQASVTAEFDLPEIHTVFKLLKEQGLDDGTTLVLRRLLSVSGKSRAFVNDNPVSASLLKQVGEQLVEVHGQFETQGLLDPKTHRVMLDDYAAVDLKAIEDAWDSWKEKESALEDTRRSIAEAREDEEYLKQSLEDLDRLAPEVGEEKTLAGLRTRLMSREQVMEALSQAHDVLTAEEGAQSRLADAYRVMERAVDKIGAEADGIMQALDRASSEIQEAVSEIQSLSASMDSAEYSLEEIDDRLHALRDQARKHKCTVDELPALRDQISEELSAIEHQDDVLAGLMKDVENAKQSYIKNAKAASAQRVEAAQAMDKAVMTELAPQKLDKATFVTNIQTPEDEESWTSYGMDKIQFLIATNPGRDPQPLNKIASGGEMARFMLALKVILAEIGGPQTLIFDEVDTGIGGSTAAAVGERLARLAENKQILVVTHSPQVAARANHHFIVMKDGGDDMRTAVVTLEQAQRREEIARMLAGETITDESRAAADKLLETGT